MTDFTHFSSITARLGGNTAWSGAALAILLFANTLPNYAQTTSTPMTTSTTKLATAESAQNLAAGENTAIRPFQFHAPQADLDDLRRRIAVTIFPDRETVPDASQGVQLATIRALARYWETEYDWRKCEARLNALPQFITEIDGLDIHFIHVRSKHANALPMIVTHGWPGSIVEQLKIIAPLTNPTSFGGRAEEAFDIVIPSMPGYGFSAKPTTTGWDTARMARAWDILMKRLGYTRYVAQGGDWGAVVVEQMALQQPAGLIGIHTNFPAAVPPAIVKALQTHGAEPAGLTAEEKRVWDRLDYFWNKGLAYVLEMASRPQTLYGIADSPIGLAAWFLDHDITSYELIARSFAGKSEGLTRDDVLDNITICWLTKTAMSSSRLYWENKVDFLIPKNIQIPVAVSSFPDEIWATPKSWAEKAYPNLIHYNRLPKGGHFAAWEQPEFFTTELRTAFRSLRGELTAAPKR